MERSVCFLNGAKMLFSTSPKAEQYLKDELWGCFKYIKIPLDVLYKMPTRDRKYFIQRHNETCANEQSQNNRTKSTSSLADINKAASMSQL